MTFPGRDMRQGTFTAGTVGSASTIPTTVTVNCGFIPTKVELINMTLLNTTMAGGPPVINPGANYLTYRAVWQEQFASSATPFTLVEALAPAASVANVSVSAVGRVTTNGISAYNGQVTPASSSQNSLVLGPQISGTNTAIATGTFTITSTATLYPGATILMTRNSVNKQLGGMYFTVATVASGTTFTIANAGWLNTANFTNGAETFKVQLVSVPPYYYPALATVVSISAANPAVVTTSVNMGLTVGQVVRLRVPSVFGMTQANNITGIISAVSGNQITLGGTTGAFSLNNAVDSSAFTAFAWPAASSVPLSYATVTPVGSGPTLESAGFYNFDSLADATDNFSYQGFVVGSSILNTASATVFGITAGDVFAWTAWRADQ
jgi:hypothetical protein